MRERKDKKIKKESLKSEEKDKNALLLTAMALLVKNFKTKDWYIDSRATAHMTHRDDCLKELSMY